VKCISLVTEILGGPQAETVNSGRSEKSPKAVASDLKLVRRTRQKAFSFSTVYRALSLARQRKRGVQNVHRHRCKRLPAME